MSFADDHAVTSTGHVFHHSQDAIGQRFSQVHGEVGSAVAALSDDDALSLDPEAWAERIAVELAVTAPCLDVDKHEFKGEGRIQVDCSGWPGIGFGVSENARIIRDGHRFRVTVTADGDLTLLQSRLGRGGTGRKADVGANALTRVYEWPQVLPSGDLQADVDDFLQELETGSAEIAEQIAARNGELAPLAAMLLSERQHKIRESRAYLGDLRLTVTRDPAADTVIPALPARVPAPGARRAATTRTPSTLRQPTPASPPATSATLDRPTLDDFYDHVVTVLGAVAIGFERSPRRFADAEEEALRDFILVTLNSHYEGAATGETFNGAGRTDILVRYGMDNAFIGECKFWGGEVKLAETFEQLLGYTTWRDNRLALIFFVRNKNLEPVITTTREWLAVRPEFGAWESSAPDGQLRCTLRWEELARKEGRLTIFFVHLPKD